MEILVLTIINTLNSLNLLVVNLSATIDKSSFRIPVPLSCICNIFIPPDLTVTVIILLPASIEFSNISLIAFAGLCITSPAAMRFTTTSSNFFMTPGSAILKIVCKFINSSKNKTTEGVSLTTYNIHYIYLYVHKMSNSNSSLYSQSFH